MTKYEINRTGGPEYERARNTPGLHVSADASGPCPEPSIGVLLERVTTSGDRTCVGHQMTDIKTPSIHTAEAHALSKGVTHAVSRLQDGEHLFVYTDSKDVFFALYGKGMIPKDSVAEYTATISETLPDDPTTYSLIVCDSDVNPAHEVARGEKQS